jgi:hypothetical protein
VSLIAQMSRESGAAAISARRSSAEANQGCGASEVRGNAR